jgi:predicted nucleic acid-binding protein
MILLDTVILSALHKREASPEVVRWIKVFRDSDLFLSVVSIGENRTRHRKEA